MPRLRVTRPSPAPWAALALLLVASPVVLPGQAPRAARPNLEGIWNSGTATPLERPAELKDKAFFTADEAARYEQQIAARNAEPAPGTAQRGTGTYNTFYREFGTEVVKTRRTSIVTDPPDGRIPPLTPAAAEIRRRTQERQRLGENPEDLGLQDQCITFLTMGPPMLPYTYNSNYQIVQTRDAIVIHAEMIHDARIVHLDGRPHLPASIRHWTGDSIGRWEGDTLVIDTTNFIDGAGFYGDAGGNFAWDENRHVVERLSLLDENTLLYRFEIDDPTAYTKPWKGELTMTRGGGPIYEFACHEANYSLTNMLRGYRATERAQAPAAPADPFARIASLIGRWEGTGEGQPGTSTVRREYTRALNDRFIRVTNRSEYPPQEKNPRGEVHTDEGFISHDRTRKALVFRQFHVEGFVNTYVEAAASTPSRVVFESEAIENIPPGFRARETYVISGPDAFEEIFELAEPGQDFAVYSRTTLRRVK